MARTVFTNISIYDGTGKKPSRGEVSVQGNRIEKVAKNGQKLTRRGAAVVDGEGATLMPGLVNAHCHMSYTGPQAMAEIPPEEHTLITMHQRAHDHRSRRDGGGGRGRGEAPARHRDQERDRRRPHPRPALTARARRRSPSPAASATSA